MSIANHAKADGTGSWPSVKTIAKEARLSEREVQYAAAELKKLGELTVQIGAGPKGVNMYSLPKIGISSIGAKFAPGAQDVVGGCTDPPKVVHTGAPEPSKSEPSNTEPSIIPISLWMEFIEMRRKIFKPLTAKAGELIREQLIKFKQKGFDPVQILEASIRSGWPDVYEPKEGLNGTRQTTSREQQRHERGQKAIENVLGRRSGLADRLREGLSGGSDRGVGAPLLRSSERDKARNTP
jgi:hypothetical protein